jgi:hypothetical protein
MGQMVQKSSRLSKKTRESDDMPHYVGGTIWPRLIQGVDRALSQPSREVGIRGEDHTPKGIRSLENEVPNPRLRLKNNVVADGSLNRVSLPGWPLARRKGAINHVCAGVLWK